MNNKPYKLIIFDWDGTLVDSIARIATSLQAASQNVCKKNISDKDARNVIGLGLREAIVKLHPHSAEKEITLLSEAYVQHYLHDNTLNEDPFCGVEQLLTQLKTDNYLLAVATGKSRIGFERCAHQYDLLDYFHTTQCASENQSKPHPQMLHKILDELSVEAKDALMIGDSVHDINMANNANVDAIGVTQGVCNTEELSHFKPLTCLEKITDLHKFLQHNRQI